MCETVHFSIRSESEVRNSHDTQIVERPHRSETWRLCAMAMLAITHRHTR